MIKSLMLLSFVLSLVAANLADGEYYIMSVKSDKAVQVPGESETAAVSLAEFGPGRDGDSQLNQVFRIENKGDYYTVKCRQSGLYWDVDRDSRKKGTKLIQYAFRGSANQLFEFVDVGKGQYRINAKNSGLALDMSHTSIIQWPWHGGSNQRWTLWKVEDLEKVCIFKVACQMKITCDLYVQMQAQLEQKLEDFGFAELDRDDDLPDGGVSMLLKYLDNVAGFVDRSSVCLHYHYLLFIYNTHAMNSTRC